MWFCLTDGYVCSSVAGPWDMVLLLQMRAAFQLLKSIGFFTVFFNSFSFCVYIYIYMIDGYVYSTHSGWWIIMTSFGTHT